MAENTVAKTTDQNHGLTTQEETREEERYLVPPVDIFEEGDALKVVADIPGVETSGLDVRVEDSILTIKAKAKPVIDEDYRYQEFELRSYYRQFKLGDQVNQEKISADLKNGTLTITLPKAEAAKPKQIKVKTA